MWTTRWDAIKATMTATGTRYAQLGQQPGYSQVAVLGQAVDLLRVFSDEMFALFSTGFADGTLAPSSQYPADYIYSCIQVQAQNDLQVLQLAADQRLNAPYSPMLTTLNVADVLAQRAMTQAEYLLPAGMRAVTYFQKSAAIRVMPYANLALIGIPYSSIDYHPDLLTIPHEIGHFLFWHGRTSPSSAPIYQQNLQHQLSKDVLSQLNNLAEDNLSALAVTAPNSKFFHHWCYVWLEELFADMLGCWVAGPVSALTLQKIVLHRPYRQIMTSDADHPVGIVRPYTHLKTLNARASVHPNWSACATLLLNQWQATVPPGMDRFGTPDAGEILLKDAVHTGMAIDLNYPVDRMVEAIRGELSSCTSDDWRIPTTAPAVAADLETQFDAFYLSQLNAPLPSLETPLTGLSDVSTWAQRYFPLSADMLAVLNKTVPAAPVPPAEWWPIALGRGLDDRASELASSRLTALLLLVPVYSGGPRWTIKLWRAAGLIQIRT